MSINIKTPKWDIENVECVLFDKDGTLIDTHIYWGKIIEMRSHALIKKLNLTKSFQNHNTLCQLMGYSLENKMLLPEGPIGLVDRDRVIKIIYNFFDARNIKISKYEIEFLFIDVHSNFINEIYDYIEIIPGAMDVLIYLKENGIKTAIITADSVNNTKKFINYFKLNSFFDLLIGRETIPYSKLSGIPAISAINTLNVEPENTVCIGDAPVDIIMSRKAELKAGIGIATGQTSYNKLLAETKYVINNYNEMVVE